MTFWARSAGLYDLLERCNGRAVDGFAAAAAELVPVGGRFLECAANVLHLLDRPGDAVAELWRVTAPADG